MKTFDDLIWEDGSDESIGIIVAQMIFSNGFTIIVERYQENEKKDIEHPYIVQVKRYYEFQTNLTANRCSITKVNEIMEKIQGYM